MVFVSIAILSICFILLLLLSNYLIDGLVRFSRSLKLSLFFISSLILAIGTSMPEFVSAFVSSLINAGELGIGVIIGSSITNICLILSVTALLSPIKRIKKSELTYNIAVLASSVLFMVLMLDFTLSRIDGLILLVSYAVYLYVLYRKEFDFKDNFNPGPYENIYIIIPGAVFGILIVGWLMVNVSVYIAEIAGLSLGFFGLTIMAISTSLPELTTSITASVIGKSKIAVANIVGSNIVNLLLIGGLVALINPIQLTYNPAFIFSLIYMVFVSALMMLLTRDKDVTRNEGVVFLILYIIYLLVLSGMN